MANYKQFSELYNDVSRAIGDLGNQQRIDEIKAVINMVYLQEIMKCDDLNPCLWFLHYFDDSQKCKSSVSITGISQANPGVVSCVHSFVAGDIVQIAGVVGMTEVNNRIFVVGTVVAGVSFQILTLDGANVNTTSFTAWSSGGTVYHRGISLASGYEQFLVGAWHGFSGEITPIDEHELEKKISYYDPGNSGLPKRYLQKKYFTSAGVEANRVLWFPLPDSTYQLRAWLEKQPDRLVNDTDVPILPFRYHDAITSGAIMRMMKYPEIQIENAVVWPWIFKNHIENLRTENRNYWRKFNQDNRSAPFLR
jgi:hypothetical protein